MLNKVSILIIPELNSVAHHNNNILAITNLFYTANSIFHYARVTLVHLFRDRVSSNVEVAVELRMKLSICIVWSLTPMQ